MGGEISKDNARVNLVVPKRLKERIDSYSKLCNLSISKTCLRVLTNPTVAEKFHEAIDVPFMLEIEDWKAEGMDHIALVVPVSVKEELKKTSTKYTRSLNNYVTAFLYYYFEIYWDQNSAETAYDYFAKKAHLA